MKEPSIGEEKNIIHSHYLGERNEHNQLYLIRNAMFEPSLEEDKNDELVDLCLQQIEAAFFLKKPAIICSHRLNFIGYLNEMNRDNNLKMLKNLLVKILRKWPNVEFMTSDTLGNLIHENDRT